MYIYEPPFASQLIVSVKSIHIIHSNVSSALQHILSGRFIEKGTYDLASPNVGGE